MSLRGLFILITIWLITIPAYSFNLVLENSNNKVLKYEVPLSTGLKYVFVAEDVKEGDGRLKISDFTTSSIQDVQIYSNLGGGYAQPVTFQTGNNEIIINNPKGDCGYILVTENGNICFWLVNYSKHTYSVKSIIESENQGCDFTEFEIQGSAGPIRYYSIDGRPCILSREIKLLYNSMQWSADEKQYQEQQSERIYEYLDSKFSIIPALNSKTELSLMGDRFLEEWGIESSLTYYIEKPNGLQVHTSAEQLNYVTEEESNRIKFDGDMLGGSAPADFQFEAYVTEAVIHYEWQISEDLNFENIKYRFNEKDLNYTFYDEGTYYVRFIGSNADGSCEVESETYTIGIGASDLRIPNAFSPNGDGVNDEWKVGYISLVEFKCWIFDKNGHQIYYFDNPALGWDGKYRGKLVSPGVYYYVIEAQGADGKKYKKGGDINIIGYKKLGERE